MFGLMGPEAEAVLKEIAGVGGGAGGKAWSGLCLLATTMRSSTHITGCTGWVGALSGGLGLGACCCWLMPLHLTSSRCSAHALGRKLDGSTCFW